MSNLSAPRNTPQLAGGYSRELTAGATIYAGAIVSIKAADGLVYPAGTSGHIVLGRAANTVASGETVRVDRGIFLVDNDTSTGAIGMANIGGGCWVGNDHMATITSGTVLMGTVWDVNSDGVYVEIK